MDPRQSPPRWLSLFNTRLSPVVCLLHRSVHRRGLCLWFEGVSGDDGSSADAAASVSEPASGSDPPETASADAPAGNYYIIIYYYLYNLCCFGAVLLVLLGN